MSFDGSGVFPIDQLGSATHYGLSCFVSLMVAVMRVIFVFACLLVFAPVVGAQQQFENEEIFFSHCSFGPTEPIYFPLDGWCSDARKKIEGAIISRPNPSRAFHPPVKFELIIESSGIISRLEVKESSGDKKIDNYCLERIQKAGPYLQAPRSVWPFGTRPKQIVGGLVYRGPFFITVSGSSVKVEAPYKPAKKL